MQPEDSIRIQQELGSDIAMVLDHVVALPSSEEKVVEACWRSVRWAKRCLEAATRPDQALFSIVQGGLNAGLRRECAAALVEIGFDGYAVGGLSVRRTAGRDVSYPLRGLPFLAEGCPQVFDGGWEADRLVGGGCQRDRYVRLCHADAQRANALPLPTKGLSDCEMLVTPMIPVRWRRLSLSACQHSRAYLRHLFMADEMLGPTLLSIHNLTYYQRLMQQARDAIEQGNFF